MTTTRLLTAWWRHGSNEPFSRFEPWCITKKRKVAKFPNVSRDSYMTFDCGRAFLEKTFYRDWGHLASGNSITSTGAGTLYLPRWTSHWTSIMPKDARRRAIHALLVKTPQEGSHLCQELLGVSTTDDAGHQNDSVTLSNWAAYKTILINWNEAISHIFS